MAALYRGQRGRMALCAALATTCTHWLMHFVLPHLVSSSEQVILAGEALALFGEALLYWLVSTPRDLPLALVASALANAASYGAGMLLLR